MREREKKTHRAQHTGLLLPSTHTHGAILHSFQFPSPNSFLSLSLSALICSWTTLKAFKAHEALTPQRWDEVRSPPPHRPITHTSWQHAEHNLAAPVYGHIHTEQPRSTQYCCAHRPKEIPPERVIFINTEQLPYLISPGPSMHTL